MVCVLTRRMFARSPVCARVCMAGAALPLRLQHADRASWVPSLYCSVAYYWMYSVIQSKRETSGKAVIVVTPARNGAPQKTMTKNDYDLMHLGEMFQVSFAPWRRAQRLERPRRACAVLVCLHRPHCPCQAPPARARVKPLLPVSTPALVTTGI